MDKCPGDKCPIKFLSQVQFSTLQNTVHVPSFKGPNTRLFHSVYGQTHSLEAQLWGKVSPHIPHFQKNEKSALACKGFQVHGQFAHKLHGS